MIGIWSIMATFLGDVLYIPKMGQLPTHGVWSSHGFHGSRFNPVTLRVKFTTNFTMVAIDAI